MSQKPYELETKIVATTTATAIITRKAVVGINRRQMYAIVPL